MKEYLREHFNLKLKIYPADEITLSGSCIYSIMVLICKPVMPYFSHHYRVFNTI